MSGLLKILLLALISLALSFRSQNLIKNHMFSKNFMNQWKVRSDLDGLQDFHQPSPWEDKNSNIKSGIKFNFVKNEYREQGLLQSIFPNKKNQLSNYRGLMMVSISHKMKNVDKNGKIFLYASIRYTDGSILPVWVLAENLNDHEQFESECIAVPYFKEIENVLIGVGACDLKKNSEDTEIVLSDAHFDIFDSRVTFDQLKKSYSTCTRIRMLRRTPYMWKTKLNLFEAQIKFVRQYLVTKPFQPRSDLTIVSQLTSDRMIFLQKNVENHRGPFSVAVYLKKPEDLKEVESYWADNELIRKYCTIHVVYANQEKEPDDPMFGRLSFTYPVNYLRNLARKYAKTDFVLYIDIDFIVTADLHDQTKDGKLM